MINKNRPLESIKDQKKTLSDFRVWVQTKDIMTDDLLDYAEKEINTIHKSAVSLCDEDKIIPTLIKTKPKKVIFVHSQSMNNLQSVSPYSQRMLHDAYSTIKHIKNSTNEIMHLNSLYFTESKSPLNNDNPTYQIPSNHSSQKNLPKISGIRSPKPKKISNFHYVTNKFRNQLSKAFMNYNPLIHLENMKLLQEADEDIKDDINRLKDVIDQDLVEITDKHYHRNKYNEYIKKKKLIIQSPNHFDQVKELEEPKAKCITTRGTAKKTTKSMPHLFKTRSSNIFTETKKKFPFKELRLNELENMQTSLKLIDEVLIEDNISKNINDYINELKDQKEHKEQYKYELLHIHESLRDIQKLKLKNAGREEGVGILTKIQRENELYLKKIPSLKQALLQDINKGKTNT